VQLRLSLVLFTFCFLSACRLSSPSPPPLPTIPGPTGIAGQVTNKEGSPALGAAVYAYRSSKGGLRGPADFEARVGGEGDYFLDLVEGVYYLAARQRHSGSDSGPPRPGDGWAIFGHNPVTVQPGMTSRADLILRGVTQPMLLKEGSLSSGDSGFTGQIIDVDGHPVVGAIALAYRSPDYHRMPDFTAAPSGEDGRFTLYLPQGGSYCLAARTKTRGQPREGEPYGLLANGAEGCRSIGKGEIHDVGTITLSPYDH